MCEALHEQAIAGKHAGVVHTHSAEKEALELFAVGGGEIKARELFFDFFAFFLIRNAKTCERRSAFLCFALCKAHDIHRYATLLHDKFHARFKRKRGVGVA